MTIEGTKRKRGFAAISPERQKEIASLGGKKAHLTGRAHVFSSEEARKAGHLGGMTVSANREHMAVIGKRGGFRGKSKPTVTPEGGVGSA